MKPVNWHRHMVPKNARSRLKRQKPCLLWFTGLSGAGKSTLANSVDHMLHGMQLHTYVLDGDNLRHGLNSDLGFSYQDRMENIRRAGEVSSLMVDAGLIVLAAFISPFNCDRSLVRKMLKNGEFIEIYLNTDISVCQQRDPKGLYDRAISGEIKDFTGISSPYEIPENPELTIDTEKLSLTACTELIINYLSSHHFIEEGEW
nr:adenylyl-sulfate kinase [Salinisphaera sp. G21_0]